MNIIAEAGTNHNGFLEVAKGLVDVAVEADADSVKFQVIYPEGLYLPGSEAVSQRQATMLSDSDYRRLAAYCEDKQIEFSASVFDRRGLDLLDELDVNYIKIASCDLNNSRFLAEAAEYGRQLVVSTGMASLGEVDQAISDVVATGNTDLVLMHCVSVYPCPTRQMNLSFIGVLERAFGFPVGLSDHTENSLAGAIAVGMGAEWIEKHFTLDRGAEGFDHAYAMEPEGLSQFVREMREAVAACARQDVKVQPSEASVRSRSRRGLYAARQISLGEVVKKEDVLTVRPEAELSPNDLGLILGRRAGRLVLRYEPLSLDMLCH